MALHDCRGTAGAARAGRRGDHRAARRRPGQPPPAWPAWSATRWCSPAPPSPTCTGGSPTVRSRPGSAWAWPPWVSTASRSAGAVTARPELLTEATTWLVLVELTVTLGLFVLVSMAAAGEPVLDPMALGLVIGVSLGLVFATAITRLDQVVLPGVVLAALGLGCLAVDVALARYLLSETTLPTWCAPRLALGVALLGIGDIALAIDPGATGSVVVRIVGTLGAPCCCSARRWRCSARASRRPPRRWAPQEAGPRSRRPRTTPSAPACTRSGRPSRGSRRPARLISATPVDPPRPAAHVARAHAARGDVAARAAAGGPAGNDSSSSTSTRSCTSRCSATRRAGTPSSGRRPAPG